MLTVIVAVSVMAWVAPAGAAPPPHRGVIDQEAVIRALEASTGTITIVKRSSPADGTDFTFNSDIPGYATFQLDDAAIDDGDGITDTIVMTEILTGTYTVSEDPLIGWAVTDIQCDDANSSGVPSQAKAEIVLGAGETVTCIFDNKKVAVIVEESDGESHVAEGATHPPLRYAGYEVRLNSQPAANVRIDVTTDDQVFVNKTVLTFTPANWAAPQRVLIYAVNDNFEEADLHFGLVNHSVSSSDPNYNDIANGYQTPFEGNRRPDAINPETDGKARTVEVAIDDNDLAAVNLEVTGEAPPLLEGSIQQRYYNVRLNSEPRDDVTVNIQSDSQVDADKTQLIFTPDNWAVRRTVQVRVIDDDDIEGDHVGQVIHTTQSDDADYDGPGALFQAFGPTGGPQPHIVQIDIIDNDYAGLIATPDRVNVLEGGGGAEYRVVLAGKPTADVTVQIATDGQVTTDVPQLAFTPLNWNIPLSVYVTAVDDNAAEGPHLSNIVHTFVSTDANYQAAPPAIVVADVADNDKPSVFVSPSLLTLAEGGGPDVYQVVLTTKPTAPVTVTMTLDDQVTVDRKALTFTPGDWDSPQVVIVTAVDDEVDESAPGETHSSFISHSVKSNDGEYHAKRANQISISIEDNDTARVLVAPTTLQTSEDGATASYVLVLNSSPTKLVRVRLLFDDTQVQPTPSEVAFDRNNWNESQTITVSAVDDDWAEGAHETVIRHETSSDDPLYSAQPVDEVRVEIEDNNQAGLAVSPTAVTVSEDGRTGSYTVTLTSQPTAAVTVEVITTAQINADALSLTFEPALWDEPQIVTISAVDDNVIESRTHETVVVHKASSSDSTYDGVPGVNVDVTILDNDGLRVLLPMIRR